jgi:hypothetical protein
MNAIVILSIVGTVTLIGMVSMIVDIVQEIRRKEPLVRKVIKEKKTSWTKELEVDTNFFDNDET